MLLYGNRTLFVEIKKLGFTVRISCHVAAVPRGGHLSCSRALHDSRYPSRPTILQIVTS